MYHHLLPLLYLSALAALPCGFAHDHMKCSSKTPDEKTLDEMKAAIEGSDLKRRKLSSPSCKGCITIDVYATVFESSTPADNILVNTTLVNEQMDILNDGFKESPFTFQLVQPPDYVTNDKYFTSWFVNKSDTNSMSFGEEIGTLYRRGTYATLNLYIGGSESNDSFGEFPLPGILNDATPPARDGVFLLNKALPGNDPGGCCNFGKVLIHEVGHWMALLHTFASSTPGSICDINDKNDYIDDTPQQAKATDFNCPANDTDTCPLLPGLDPINNYMDYSSDDCYTEFTPQQIARMYFAWSIYRKKDEACSPENSLFELKLRTDDFPDDVSWTLVSDDGTVSYSFTTPGGIDNGLTSGFSKPNFEYDQEICLEFGKSFNFTITDTAGDGVSSTASGTPGFYEISLSGAQLKTNVNFGFIESTLFSTPPKPATTPAPTPAITTPPTTSEPTPATTPAPTLEGAPTNVNDPNWTYELPVWWATIESTYEGDDLKRCFKRQFPPTPGITCATREKTCFFGNQMCTDGLQYPDTKCFCNGSKNSPGTWSCEPVVCPVPNVATTEMPP